MAEETNVTETMYAIRRTDGSLMFGEFSFSTVDGPDDWSLAYEDAADGDGAAEYELVRMDVEVVGRKTLPLCFICDRPSEVWGLCPEHAEKEDPEAYRLLHGGTASAHRQGM